MRQTFRLFRSSFSDWYYDLFLLLAVNIVWLVLTILIIPMGPATAGLYHICNEIAKGEPVSFSVFVAGMQRRLGLSFRLWLTLLIMAVLIIVNMIFYFSLHTTAGQIIGIIWIYIIVFFLMMQNYTWALLEQMEHPSVLKIIRNAALMTLDNVALTISMSLLTLVAFALSFLLGFLPILLGLFAFLAIFQCKCMIMLFEKYEKKGGSSAVSGS